MKRINKACKSIITFALVLAMLLPCTTIAKADGYVSRDRMQEVFDSYTHGDTWYGNCGGTQCWGFGNLVSVALYGCWFNNLTPYGSIYDAQVGDILQFGYAGNNNDGHTVIVTGVDEYNVYYMDCNGGNDYMIRKWGCPGGEGNYISKSTGTYYNYKFKVGWRYANKQTFVYNPWLSVTASEMDRVSWSLYGARDSKEAANIFSSRVFGCNMQSLQWSASSWNTQPGDIIMIRDGYGYKYGVVQNVYNGKIYYLDNTCYKWNPYSISKGDSRIVERFHYYANYVSCIN